MSGKLRVQKNQEVHVCMHASNDSPEQAGASPAHWMAAQAKNWPEASQVQGEVLGSTPSGWYVCEMVYKPL